MKLKFSKKDIINIISTLVTFTIVLIMFLLVGLRFNVSNGISLNFIGFGKAGSYISTNNLTLNLFKDTRPSQGGQIFISAILIITLSSLLVVNSILIILVPKTKVTLQLIYYIVTYLLLFIILILSVLIFIETFLFVSNGFGTYPRSLSIISLIFLILLIILPLVDMVLVFNKTYFKMIFKKRK